MEFFVVENRSTDVLRLCQEAARLARVNLTVIRETQSTRFEKFKSSYEHLSSNPLDFELICFRRYFLLDKILPPSADPFVLLDSDVLVFPGIADHIQALTKGADFGGSSISDTVDRDKQVSPHVSYWTREALSDFVNYLAQAYDRVELLSQLRDIANEFRARGERGGVSDMTLLYLWSQGKRTVPLNVKAGNGVIDHNVSLSSNFKFREFELSIGAKRIEYARGAPYFIARDGGRVAALAIHFQGKAKLYMRHALERSKLRMSMVRLYVASGRAIRSAAYRFASFH